jgi:acyl transferase domain-containing protein
MSQRSVVFMFSGQGSQYYQMGRVFFDENAKFRNILLQLNDVAAPLLGRSIIDVLYEDGRRKDESFDKIKLTSAAIFIIEYSLARVLIDDGIKPDCLLASSMGLYAAAAIAGVLEPREVLQSLTKLAAVYEARCPKGAMIAIFGSPKLHRDLTVLRENSDIAAVNFNSHFVISTVDANVNEITAALDRENIVFHRVPVSYAFHSRWMDGAREAALEILAALQYRQPTIPLICCAQTSVIERFSATIVWNSVRNPIEFERTIAEMEKGGPRHYVDVGPAGTLATFLKYALPSTSASKASPVLSPFGGELKNYDRLTSELGSFEQLSPDAKRRNSHG